MIFFNIREKKFLNLNIYLLYQMKSEGRDKLKN